MAVQSYDRPPPPKVMTLFRSYGHCNPCGHSPLRSASGILQCPSPTLSPPPSHPTGTTRALGLFFTHPSSIAHLAFEDLQMSGCAITLRNKMERFVPCPWLCESSGEIDGHFWDAWPTLFPQYEKHGDLQGTASKPQDVLRMGEGGGFGRPRAGRPGHMLGLQRSPPPLLNNPGVDLMATSGRAGDEGC